MERILIFLAGAGFGAWASRVLDRTPKAFEAPFYPEYPSQGASAVKIVARTKSAMREIRALIIHTDLPDTVLEAKIRARISRTFARPGSVQVRVNNGIVSLTGSAREAEILALSERLSGLRGVKGVENNLESPAPAPPAWEDAEPGGEVGSSVTDMLPRWAAPALALLGLALAAAALRLRGDHGMLVMAGGAALAGAGLAESVRAGAEGSAFRAQGAQADARSPGPKGRQSLAPL